jgi:hypothetical protein
MKLEEDMEEYILIKYFLEISVPSVLLEEKIQPTTLLFVIISRRIIARWRLFHLGK